ncbi:cytochrome c [Anatilimnocola sp. NA78]|uniref:cytochrome c n=1 Tax=Anatilimnocola sp. NA78 TaxID=3415683 RepID=UPI003CE522FF
MTLSSLRWLLGPCCFFAALLAIAQDPTSKPPATPLLDVPPAVMENVHKLSDNVYSSGGPNGEAAFEILAKLGIKTIVSVDGAQPDLVNAKKYGMKYVHVPIGYDALPKDKALIIAKAVKESKGPVLIHCHHGKHRGPAAAAVACVAVNDWTHEQALAWMKQAGTSPAYGQLIKDAGSFEKPLPAELDKIPAEALPEAVAPPPLVDAMLKIDERFDEVQKHFKVAVDVKGPDWNKATSDALQLDEDFREFQRLPTVSKMPAEFQQFSSDMQKSAAELHAAIEGLSSGKTKDTATATKVIDRLKQQCTACHKKYRDMK